MFSVPPATTTSASPHWMAWAASITAFRPEPQTLLTVVAPDGDRQAGADGRLPGDVLAQPGAEHVAENHLVDLVPATPARFKAALMATLPKVGAGTSASGPGNRRSASACRRQAKFR